MGASMGFPYDGSGEPGVSGGAGPVGRASFAVMRLAAPALSIVLAACSGRAPLPQSALPGLESREVRARGNPILSDGADYSADPAPLVANGRLYIRHGDTLSAFDIRAK